MSDDQMLARAQYFVDCKYVARADDRQKSMGLAYVEAERQDLAREMVNFAMSYVAPLRAVAAAPASPAKYWQDMYTDLLVRAEAWRAASASAGAMREALEQARGYINNHATKHGTTRDLLNRIDAALAAPQAQEGDHPPALRQRDMTIIGGLFALRFLPDGNMAELYIEDDEFYHLKASFNREWLNDLRIVAAAGDDCTDGSSPVSRPDRGQA